MQHPFVKLEPEYNALLAGMVCRRDDEAVKRAFTLLRYKLSYAGITAKTGIPIIWIAASFEREAASNFKLSPAQGDPWSKVSVHVPQGRGPFRSWMEAAIDAYQINQLDQVGATNWTWARACYEGELFNGFGYRNHGVHSPYLWAGTNIYRSGKYVADGHFSPGTVDRQIGIVSLMKALIEIDPSLALADPLVMAPPVMPVTPVSAPFGLGEGVAQAKWIQESLNEIMQAHLLVDGSYGRFTRNAVLVFQKTHDLQPDGICGKLTLAALQAARKSQ